jgi:hypothetical protein
MLQAYIGAQPTPIETDAESEPGSPHSSDDEDDVDEDELEVSASDEDSANSSNDGDDIAPPVANTGPVPTVPTPATSDNTCAGTFKDLLITQYSKRNH